MKDNEIINEMNNSLPEGAERSLCSCGGINGLVGLLPEDSDIEALSLIYRALADSNRIKILAMLEVQPLCVCVIKAVLGIADSKLSYHLSILKKADFISGEQKEPGLRTELLTREENGLIPVKVFCPAGSYIL